VELIAAKAGTLRNDFQEELLRYLDYLVQRQEESREAQEWSQFSAAQLSEQYAESDSIYDKEA
jgi:hypothetical protein